MNVRRAAVGAAAAVALAGSLSGCEVRKEFAAACVTDPPAPHQNQGFVDVDLEVPLRVRAGSTFSVRVDSMVGYPYTAGPGAYPYGTLSVTGAVSPSGDIGVGSSLFPVPEPDPYPETLTFQATGQPGDTILVAAVRGGSVHGDFPEAFFVSSCVTLDDVAEVATITLT